VPAFDDRLRERLARAAAPAASDPGLLFHDVARRRARRATTRKVGTGALAVLVVTATVAGFAVLDRAFRRDDATVFEAPAEIEGPLVVSVWSDPSTDHRTAHLELIPSDGSASRVLTAPGDGYDMAPSASPDGRSVSYVHYAPDYESRVHADLRVLDLVSGQTRSVATGEIMSTAWSPDGRQIAFLGTIDDVFAIWVVPLEGGVDPRILVKSASSTIEGRTLWGSPDWSPDGTALTFEVSDLQRSDGTGEDPGVVTFELATGSMTFLAPTDGDVAAEPAWSPDGRQIAYAITSGIWSVPPTGAEPTLIAGTTNVQSNGAPSQPVWAPGGMRMAYVRQTGDGLPALWVDALDGSDPVRVAPYGDDATWLRYNAEVAATMHVSDSPSATVTQDPEPALEGQDVGLIDICASRGGSGDSTSPGRDPSAKRGQGRSFATTEHARRTNSKAH
jgi:Tol biopolymer transport system component